MLILYNTINGRVTEKWKKLQAQVDQLPATGSKAWHIFTAGRRNYHEASCHAGQ